MKLLIKKILTYAFFGVFILPWLVLLWLVIVLLDKILCDG